jgi:hypothetical protein
LARQRQLRAAVLGLLGHRPSGCDHRLQVVRPALRRPARSRT